MSNFNAGDSLGSRSPNDIARYLTEIKNEKDAKFFMHGSASGMAFLSMKKPYTHTGSILGFIPPVIASTTNLTEIVAPSKVDGERNIVGKRIKITLDKFYVHNYPGLGTHSILCEFSGKNQLDSETEELRFALRFRANDKGSASLSGVPIFMGITVGSDGISFEGRTINVSSKLDEVILETLESSAFKGGLSLITTAQPALIPFSSLAAAAVKSSVKRSDNAQVHNFNLGLDFSPSATSARLQYGSYIVVQNDETSWDWNELEWNRDSMVLQYKKHPTKEFEFNYMIFHISEFSDNPN